MKLGTSDLAVTNCVCMCTCSCSSFPLIEHLRPPKGDMVTYLNEGMVILQCVSRYSQCDAEQYYITTRQQQHLKLAAGTN